MESRNLITAREMTEKGNWLIPTMNGELRLEKPPLPTWEAAIVEHISPDDIALQRVPAGIMGVVLVNFLLSLCEKHHTGKSGDSLITAMYML